MNELSTVGPPPTPKPSFWGTSPGLVGMLGLALLGAGVLWFLSWVIPIILVTFVGAIGVVVSGTVLVLLLAFLFTQNKLKSALLLGYQVFCRKLYNGVIDQNPIVILRTNQSKAKKRQEEAARSMNLVNAAKRTVEEAVANYTNQMNSKKAEYNVFTREGNNEDAELAMAAIGELKTYLEEMQAMQTNIVEGVAVLQRVQKITDRLIKQADFRINNIEIRRRAVKDTASAWSSFRSLFKQPTEEQEQDEQAFRALAEQQANDLGKIDTFFHEFNQVLVGVTTGDKINAEKARMSMNEIRGITFDEQPRVLSSVKVQATTVPVRYPTSATRK